LARTSGSCHSSPRPSLPRSAAVLWLHPHVHVHVSRLQPHASRLQLHVSRLQPYESGLQPLESRLQPYVPGGLLCCRAEPDARRASGGRGGLRCTRTEQERYRHAPATICSRGCNCSNTHLLPYDTGSRPCAHNPAAVATYSTLASVVTHTCNRAAQASSNARPVTSDAPRAPPLSQQPRHSSPYAAAE